MDPDAGFRRLRGRLRPAGRRRLVRVGAFQALVYDGLRAAGQEGRFAAVIARCEAVGLAVQVPVAGAASVLFAAGGYGLAGWVSVGTCLAAAGLAATMPDHRPEADDDDAGEGSMGYVATLRAGLHEVATTPRVRAAVLLVAVLYGSEALEEYFGLLAAGWGVSAGVVPLALLAIPLAGRPARSSADRRPASVRSVSPSC